MTLLVRSGSAMLAAAALAVAGAPRVASADDPALSLAPEPSSSSTAPRAMPPITIRIAVASASEEEGEVDPKASDIYEHLPAKFHSIRMIEERTITVFFGEVASVPLPSGTEVRLLPVAVHHGQLHLQLEMPEVLNTSMRMSNSRAFYVGGVTHGDGTLIFKLVPEFSAYVETPAPARGAPPQTRPAGSKR